MSTRGGGEISHPDLKQRLVFSLLLPMFLLVTLGAASDYFVARRLTDDAYDQSIAGVAEGLGMTLERDRDNDLPVHFHAMMHTLQRIDAPDTWRYVVVAASGVIIDGDAALAHVAQPPDVGGLSFRTVSIANADERVATFHYAGPQGRATIVVAATLQRRRAATSAIVSATLWPNVALMILALVLLPVGVRVALRPLDRLGQRIDDQRADDLTPLPLADTPRETQSLLRALNQLIERLRLAAGAQQAFLNQAAHQLRTPLAALRARIELLRDMLPHDAARRCSALEADVARLSHLTTQLLTLGRTDRGAAAALVRSPVDLPSMIADLAASFDDRARSGDVQLAFDLAPLEIDGIEWMLREALSNLVDNALAHAPQGSTVTLRCGATNSSDSGGFVEVEDQGEGIDPELRERAFEPFVRLAEDRRQGSGLGLAIVRSIGERHRAVVSLSCGTHGKGTLARIHFRA